jgi:hypothetical protein
VAQRVEVFGPDHEGTFDLVIDKMHGHSGLSSDETVAFLCAPSIPECYFFDFEGRAQALPPSLARAFRRRRLKP